MRGRKPKPSHLKLIAGNPGKRKLNAKEPKPAKGIPQCPAHLKGRARDAWKYIAPQLDRMGVLTTADGKALELLCDAYGEYREARSVVESAGSTYTTTTQQGDTMYRPRPEVAIAQNAWSRAKAMLVEFGLTPSARSRVESNGKAPADEEERFFGAG